MEEKGAALGENTKLVVGPITALGEPHHFVIGEVTASVAGEIGGRDITHNLNLKVRVAYRPDATLPELQEALRVKAVEVLAEILAENRRPD